MTPEALTPRRAVAVVTGGSRGIGKAVVEELARAGLIVRFTFLKSAERARLLEEELRRAGCEVASEQVDGRDAGACRAFVAKVIAELGRLDVLVNNAAVTADRLFPMMSPSEWSAVLETSLNGLFGTTQPATIQMMRQRSGRIVNITSVSGLIGMAGQANYCTAKASIIGFTRALAKEMAAWGVCVNAVAPGYIDTDMVGALTAEQRSAAEQRVPLRRFGTAAEVATLVRFLALEAPPYLIGQTLVLDGGLTA